METDILGEYDLSNRYFINVKTPSNLSSQTILHEVFHMIFTLQSSYGNFMHTHRRIVTVDNRFQHIGELLLTHSRLVQESACTFAEVIFITQKESFDSAQRYIQSLKEHNRTYYNYLKPLLPFLWHMQENESSNAAYKMSAQEMMNLIISAVHISLNVDLTQIDTEIFRSKKSFRYFSSLEDTSRKYFPNRIFCDTLKQLLSLFAQDATSDEIQRRITAFVVEKEPVYDEKSLYYIQEKHRQYFRHLYHDSPDFHVIEEILEEITLKSVDAIDIIGSGIPASGNTQYPSEDTSGQWEKVIALSRKQTGVLFVSGDKETILAQTFTRHIVPLQLCTALNNHVISTYLDYVQGKQYFMLLPINKTKLLCNLITPPIIVNYKISRELERKLFYNSSGPIFVYCDRSYINAIEVIRSYSDQTMPFQLLQYDEKHMGFDVLIIKLKPKFYFLLPMLKLAEICLERDIQNNVIQLELNLDIGDDLKSAIDLAINCIFYYRLTDK